MLMLRKYIAHVGMMVVVLFLVGTLMALLWGTIADNANVSSSYTRTAGDKAAGHFVISNEDGEYGAVDKQDLENNLDECKIDRPGFREPEPLLIGLEGDSCVPNYYNIESMIVTPLYDEEYYTVKILDDRGVSPQNYGLGPGLSAGS
jgi:hypothetical protein